MLGLTSPPLLQPRLKEISPIPLLNPEHTDNTPYFFSIDNLLGVWDYYTILFLWPNENLGHSPKSPYHANRTHKVRKGINYYGFYLGNF